MSELRDEEGLAAASGEASRDEECAEGIWPPTLVRWAFETLPDHLDEAERTQLEELRLRWDTAVLDHEVGGDAQAVDLVQRYQLLARIAWHPALADRIRNERQSVLDTLDDAQLDDVAKLAIESGHLLLVEQEDLTLAQRSQDLEREREIVLAIVGRLRQRLSESGERRAARAERIRELDRLALRLRDQNDETNLTRRLEATFGRRAFTIFSRFTFWCLVALLVLLIWEMNLDHESELLPTLLLIDSGLCLVFLWEFVVRIWFVDRKARWFRRHFLTDFLPALPFALLTGPLHAFPEGTGSIWISLLRLLRIPIYARYLRFLQPFVATVRLIVFWVRGMDRLVQGLAPFLNRTIVLFEPEPDDAKSEDDDRSFRDEGVLHEVPDEFVRLTPAMRRERATGLLVELQSNVSLYCAPERTDCIPEERPRIRDAWTSRRVDRAEDIVAGLEEAEAADVERVLPRDSVVSLGRLLRAMDLPLLRHVPFLGGVVRASSGSTPADRVAHAGRKLGGYARSALSFVTGWADLAGVLTPTVVVDRLATALMKSTQRPAVRLLLFGSFFVLVKLFFEALPSWRNEGLVRFLDRFVATPLLVLGAVCLVLLLLARWLKRVAGEASERFLRAAEARFVNLLELLRRSREEVDRDAVVDRLVSVELRDKMPLSIELSAAMDELRGRATPRTISNRARRLALLLLDFQDGAPLHRTDTKLAEQFLSHPDLWNLRHEHLRTSTREDRRIAKLDLEKGGVFSGAFLWFDLVTQAVSVRVATLCSTYNLHLLPRDEVETASQERRERHERLVRGGAELSVEAVRGRPYRDSFFHALHFLDPSERWLDEVRNRYGDAVAHRLVLDRALLVREIFGTRSLHRLPEKDRSFNPFDWYESRVGSGRILLLPLRMIWSWFKLTWLLLRLVASSARAILDPKVRAREAIDQGAPFSVARRKLRRLKKPLLIAAIELAVRIDPEYLGLDDDGKEREARGAWEHDLARAEPTPREVERVRRFRADVRGRLLYLPKFVERVGGAALDSRSRRRLACAFAMDEGGIARLAAAEERARAWLLAYSEGREIPSGGLPYGPTGRPSKSTVDRGFHAMRGWLGQMSPKERRFLERAKKHRLGDLDVVCQAFADASAKRPSSVALELAARFDSGRERFLGRLETLQALLALIMQDLELHESLIRQLGLYDGHDLPSARSA
ncbi:MAG: ion transporter [Planctomycetes bacterium]|nr:ion transporter [Planctomycetota bacterium]